MAVGPQLLARGATARGRVCLPASAESDAHNPAAPHAVRGFVGMVSVGLGSWPRKRACAPGHCVPLLTRWPAAVPVSSPFLFCFCHSIICPPIRGPPLWLQISKRGGVCKCPAANQRTCPGPTATASAWRRHGRGARRTTRASGGGLAWRPAGAGQRDSGAAGAPQACWRRVYGCQRGCMGAAWRRR